MGLKIDLFSRVTNYPRPVQGRTPEASQILLLEPSVIKYIKSYRQLVFASKEAGGQLFGEVNEELVNVVKATGPYRGDERGRYYYRSKPVAAQKAIEKQSKSGLLYLGEWHTHFEDEPNISTDDMDAMHRLLRNSSLNVKPLLMIIVGRSNTLKGLNVSWVDFKLKLSWSLREV